MNNPSDGDEAQYLAFRERVKGTNINEQTLLATDYLNHFNEIVMLLEMVADMPEILEDVKEWRPKTYQEHFRDSTVADKDLAVEAYEFAPDRFRRPFDETVEQMNRIVANSIRRLEAAIAEEKMNQVRMMASLTSLTLQRLIDHASANIHGSAVTMDQSEIDALLKT